MYPPTTDAATQSLFGVAKISGYSELMPESITCPLPKAEKAVGK